MTVTYHIAHRGQRGIGGLALSNDQATCYTPQAPLRIKSDDTALQGMKVSGLLPGTIPNRLQLYF